MERLGGASGALACAVECKNELSPSELLDRYVRQWQEFSPLAACALQPVLRHVRHRTALDHLPSKIS